MAPEIPSPLLTPLFRLLGIRYPIIQGGMVWTAGAKLAVAVSEAGALGVLGAGSMKPDALRQAVRDVRQATKAPFGVNIPLMREDRLDLIGVCEEEHVRIVITSSGDPSALSPRLEKADDRAARGRHREACLQSGGCGMQCRGGGRVRSGRA